MYIKNRDNYLEKSKKKKVEKNSLDLKKYDIILFMNQYELEKKTSFKLCMGLRIFSLRLISFTQDRYSNNDHALTIFQKLLRKHII